jgi:hypothetical protein
MTEQKTKPNRDKPGKPVPVAIQRLLDEVRNEGRESPIDYNRMHNRHNRS